MKKILVIPDLQIPLHDSHVVSNIIRFSKTFKADQTVTLGDEMDMTELGRWSEGKAEWFAQTLDDNRNMTVDILWELGTTDMIRSNHTDRLYNVIMRKIPAFLALPELKYDKFMKFDEIGIEYHRKPYSIAKGWVAIHGDEGALNPNAGLTSLGLSRKMGLNVICGHTHRAGQSAFSEASGGVLRRVHRGVDSGHLMDIRRAHYVSAPNWQQAFQIMTEDERGVQIDMINIEKDGTFIVHGKRYGRVR